MQAPERGSNLLNYPSSLKMGTPHKNMNGGSLPPGAQDGEEVRTLFVSGLPMDVRLRELYLLFRGYDGYEGSFLKLISSKPGKPPQPIAFVSFKNRVQAERALEELQGIRFDPASSQTLRLEFARTNSRVAPRQPPTSSTQGTTSSMQSLSLQKNGPDPAYGTCVPVLPSPAAIPQQLTPNLYTPSETWPQRLPLQMAYQNVSQLSSPSPTLSPASSFTQLPILSILESDNSYPVQPQMYYTVMQSPSPTPTPVPGQQHPILLPSMLSTSSSSSSSTPCSTLFVANLELQHTEEEVRDIFRSCSGFVRAKIFTRGGPPVAFVEFKSVECARSAMDTFQGHVLPNSKRGSGIRIEYARQRMGEQPRSPVIDPHPTPPSPIQVQTIHTGQPYQQHQPNHQPNSSGPSSSSSSPSSSSSELPPQVWTVQNRPALHMPYSNGFAPQPQMMVNGYPNRYVTPWPLKYN